MFYKVIKSFVNEVEQFRGVTTVYEIREMPIETRDEKIEASILLMKLVKGIGYPGSLANLKLSNKFNEGQYNQAISNAISYSRKEAIVVGSLQKLLTILVQDINTQMPTTFKESELKKCLESEPNELGVRNFDSFFETELTSVEKDKVKLSKKTGGLTGLKDLDWKAMSFSEDAKDGTKIAITSRLELSRVSNTDMRFILEKKMGNKEVSVEMQELYEHLDKVGGKKRKGVLTAILVCVLFGQDYKKYETLVTNLKHVRKNKIKS